MSKNLSSRKGRTTARRVCGEDVAIAHRIRALRLERGLSQTVVARSAGVSFQQFQKYEHGDNRISAGRLQRVAVALGVPITALYGSGAPSDARVADSLGFLRTHGALRLARAYAGISSRHLRVALVAVAENLAKGGG